MSTHSFTIIASGLDPSDPDFEDRFFETGCDDATIAYQKGVIMLAFDREAKNLIHAVVSAVTDVENAGATIERVEPDGLVSLSDIAVRANKSRAAVSLWSRGERGENFPRPIARHTTTMPLWDWVEVSSWLYQKQQLPRRTVVEARIVRYMNKKVSEKSEDREEARA